MAGEGSEYILQAWAVANHKRSFIQRPRSIPGGGFLSSEFYKEQEHD